MTATEKRMRGLVGLVLAVTMVGAVGCQSHLFMQAASVGAGVAPAFAPATFQRVTQGIGGLAVPLTLAQGLRR